MPPHPSPTAENTVDEHGEHLTDTEFLVDQFGLPGDSQDVDLNNVYEKISQIMKDADITWTVSGDDVLNYYMAPKLVTNLQICVAKNSIKKASEAFAAALDFCFPFRPATGHWQHLFTAFPRFKLAGLNCFFNVVPDTFYGFQPLTPDKFVANPSRTFFPVLHLKHYVAAAARHVIIADSPPETRTWWSMTLEFLIDGMDIDSAWCQKHLPPGQATGVVLVRSTRARKINRIGRKYNEGMFTCYINDEDERAVVLQTPGRD